MELFFEVETPSGVETFGSGGDPCWGLSAQTQNAGGFGQGSVTVPRPEWVTREDLLLCHSRIYAAGGRTVYEGRVADVSAVDQHAAQLSLEGWAAHLDDDQFFRALYVDRDLSHMQGDDENLRAALIALAALTPTDGSVQPSPNDGAPTVQLAIIGNASTAVGQVCALTYGTQGLGIGSVYYEFSRGTNVTSSWNCVVETDETPVFNSSTDSSNLASSASSTGTHSAAAGETRVRVSLTSPAADGGTEGQTHSVVFKRLAFFGTHGLTKRGVAPEQGYYPGDIIRNAVEIGAPMLTVPDGAVELGSPVVFQAAYLDPTTVRSIILDAGAYGTPRQEVPEWGVYDDREFFWRSPGGGRRWRVRRDQMALPTDDGPSAQDRFAEIVVRWDNGSGETFTVGAPGSGADDEDERLRTPDFRNNPSTKISRRRMMMDAGVTYLEGAILLGQAKLADVNSNRRRGSATLTGTVRDTSGVEEPAWAVRACDTLVVEDEPGVTEPAEQYVNGTSYDHEGGVLTATLGVEPLKTELILARLRNAMGV